MKITRQKLAEMVASEVRRRLRELVETPDDEDAEDDPRPKKAGKTSADQSPSPKGDVPVGPRATTGSPDADIDDTEDPDEPATDGDQPDPDDDVDHEEPSGAVNDEMSGKTIQAITIEPESKVMPGSKEIVIATNESTDVLRIIVSPTGIVSFFFRGQLHDLP